MAVTIYHNPRCTKSRQTLELVQESGVAHTVVLYLEQTPSADEIAGLARKLGLSVADLMRHGESEFLEATDLPDLEDDERLAEWLVNHPIVVERPIVVNNDTGQAAIGRPPENVIPLLS